MKAKMKFVLSYSKEIEGKGIYISSILAIIQLQESLLSFHLYSHSCLIREGWALTWICPYLMLHLQDTSTNP